MHVFLSRIINHFYILLSSTLMCIPSRTMPNIVFFNTIKYLLVFRDIVLGKAELLILYFALRIDNRKKNNYFSALLRLRTDIQFNLQILCHFICEIQPHASCLFSVFTGITGKALFKQKW